MEKDPQEVARNVVEKMIKGDDFSQWLGIEVQEIGPGYCTLHLEVRPEMANGFGITHGGITYSMADSALAFASNSHGRMCVSVETSISHTKPVHPGDQLTAVAKEKSLSNKIGIYEVSIKNQNGILVALFKGTVYRTSEYWMY